jgi:hypothetical protein
VVHICNPSYLGDSSRRIARSRPAQANLVRPCLKNKRLGSVSQVVEHLPSKHKAILSTAPPPKKKREKLKKDSKRSPCIIKPFMSALYPFMRTEPL